MVFNSHRKTALNLKRHSVKCKEQQGLQQLKQLKLQTHNNSIRESKVSRQGKITDELNLPNFIVEWPEEVAEKTK